MKTSIVYIAEPNEKWFKKYKDKKGKWVGLRLANARKDLNEGQQIKVNFSNPYYNGTYDIKKIKHSKDHSIIFIAKPISPYAKMKKLTKQEFSTDPTLSYIDDQISILQKVSIDKNIVIGVSILFIGIIGLIIYKKLKK